MEKVLFDTDIGSDIDDALALGYLLSEPECKLMGITTVSGCPELRAEMASAICRNVGRGDVPVHVGAPEALLVSMLQKDAPQARMLGNWEHDKFAPGNTAVEFMRRTILDNPGEITLLCVGPFTNAALLFASCPEIPGMLKRLVLMSGRFENGGDGEWNVINDPHAGAIVYGNGTGVFTRPPVHLSCGLDVTLKCRLEREECRRRISGHRVLAPVADFAEVWFEHSNVATFHDPLSAVCIFHPEVCEWKDTFVRISLVPPTAGYTVCDWRNQEKPHRIAAGVDPERFFDIYFRNISRLDA